MATTNDSTEPKRKRRFGRKNKPPRDPNNPGRWQQFKQVWSMTRKHDPAAMWWMLLAALAVLLLGLLIGLWLDMIVYVMIVSLPLAILAAVFILARRAEQAAFSQIEGQPGATAAVMGTLKRTWYYDEEPVAAEAGGKVRGMRDLHNAAMIFRVVGLPGVVLISEGPKAAAKRLSETERKKVARIVGPEVPVHALRVGHGEDEVRLSKLVKTMKKLDKNITKQEALVVHKRLKAISATARPPLPAGVDPRKARMDRRALRGR
ncbi:DUF4191 domain-containing protein [Ornithinimicrobium faecis]|uniref:DUF4191 domain-containing protein n=1 Tax=Ornithinimicrobium faecis TaxID=2934158 RepID=A0ABY4YYB5_9MICO|nr:MULTISPECIES: DUF4191 domain-containing protein [unclassified Ornithinimicrobium]USQ81602.1 DUF4191 domain-containing protein [Ornithinimicrobium sp. HY1793]